MKLPPPEDLAPALAELPLFPLREAVLFPGVLLPLHVFEPRYLHMVRDVVETHRSLSIVLVTDHDADLAGRPPIAELATVGTIVEHTELPGGRYNVVLLGRARVRLEELPFVPPYRRARASLLSSIGGDVPAIELAALHGSASAFANLLQNRDKNFRIRLPAGATPGVLADACAHYLIIDARERQRVLETLDVRERVRIVTEVLTLQRATLAPDRDQPN